MIIYYLTLALCFVSQLSGITLAELREQVNDKRGTPNQAKKLEILNVSFDPTREFYDELNAEFSKWWKERTGQAIDIDQSHGGSGTQSRAVTQGLQADVVTLSTALDIDAISKRSKLLPNDWQNRLPNHSVPFTSAIVFMVREGNPKHIRDWDDLVKEGVSVIAPNPKTSGGARWIYLAAWGYAMKKFNGDETKVKQFMSKLYHNTPTLDTGARAAATTFVQREIGDVLLSWENEAHLAMKEMDSKKFQMIYPSISIHAEPPVAWIDAVVDKKGTRDVAEFYLAFLYTKQGQRIGAKHFLRPIDPEIFALYLKQFPKMPMLDIDRDFGGWDRVEEIHFRDGGVFD